MFGICFSVLLMGLYSRVKRSASEYDGFILLLKKKKEMSLAFMNYLNINQNIWHAAAVSGILNTRLIKVWRPLNGTWMQCERVYGINSLSACSKVLLCCWLCTLRAVSDETCIYGTFTAGIQSSPVYTFIIEEPLFIQEKRTIMRFIASPGS